MNATEVYALLNKKISNVTLAFSYKGSVASVSDLPDNAETGDLYTVGGAQYVWDGTAWVNVKKATAGDVSYNSEETYQAGTVGAEVTALKEDLTATTGNTVITGWVNGKFVSTNGSTYNPSGAVNNDAFRYVFVDCSAGDVFTVSGTGGGNPRLWAFADSSNNILSHADENASETNAVITAPTGATRLILNDKAKTSESYKGELLVIKVDGLEKDSDDNFGYFKTSEIFSGDLLYRAMWVSGGWSDINTNPVPSTNSARIRASITFTCGTDTILTIKRNSNYDYVYGIYKNGAVVDADNQWNTQDKKIKLSYGTYTLYIAIRNHDNTSAVYADDVLTYGIQINVNDDIGNNATYMQIGMERVVSQIMPMLSNGANVAVFGFNTDQHVYKGDKKNAVVRGLKVLSQLTWNLPYDFVCLGGDAPDGSRSTTIAQILSDCLAVQEPLHDANCPVVPITGNHDAFQNNGNITGGELFNVDFKRLVNTWFAIKGWNTNNTNGYWDSVAHKIRFVWLDDNVRDDYSWMERTDALSALLSGTPNDYKIIIISHHVISDAVTNPLWIQPLGIQTRLASYKDQIICCISGHTHADISEVSNGVLFISTTMAQFGTDNEGNSRTIETEGETAFDTYVVDNANDVINAVRYGYGANRTWHTDKIAITGTGTVNVETALTGTIAWTSDDTNVCTINNGDITGVSSGECLVRATDNTGAEECWWVVVS